MENIKNILLGIVIRITGLILFILGMLIMIAPFVIVWMVFGINKANVIMSSAMRHPINMLIGDEMGDLLLHVNKEINNNRW